VAFKKSASSAGPRVWTVAELGAFYTEHRSELLAHANRVLKDSAKVEEMAFYRQWVLIAKLMTYA